MPLGDARSRNALTTEYDDLQAPLPLMPVVFLGERSRTADRNALMRAKQLKKQGANRDQIWAETGWFQHHQNGRWNYETADDRMYQDRGSPREGRFFDQYPHPEVQAAYPTMNPRLQHRMFEPNVPTVGQYNPNNRNIALDPTWAGSDEAALHELQHAVDDAEGYTPQPGPQMTASHVRTGQVEQRRLLTPEQRRATPPWAPLPLAPPLPPASSREESPEARRARLDRNNELARIRRALSRDYPEGFY